MIFPAKLLNMAGNTIAMNVMFTGIARGTGQDNRIGTTIVPRKAWCRITIGRLTA